MPRRIHSAALQDSGGRAPDGYFDRVIKYIPADIVGAWVAATGILSTGDEDLNRPTVLWIAFAAGVLLTAAWTYKQTAEPGKPVATLQIILATLAFAVWVFALGGPFADFDWYRQQYGSLVLIAFTLGTGLLVPRE